MHLVADDRGIVTGSQPTRELLPDEVVLHWANLADPRWDAAVSGGSSLAPDELSRAGRFKFAADARRYKIGRALLRRLLGQYTGLPPDGLSISYSEYGKPYLDLEDNAPHFNLSHTGDMAVFAFALRQVGVDIEACKIGGRVSEASRIFVSTAESQLLSRLPANMREQACLQIWVRKEALLKGAGIGLIDGVRQIESGWSADGKSAAAISLPGHGDWLIEALENDRGVMGAVALARAAGKDLTISQFILCP